LDSSLVAIHTNSVSAKENTYAGSLNFHLVTSHSFREIHSQPIKFAFTLKSSNIPSGDLIFRFDIVSASGIVHTTEEVKYQLAIPMVATQIAFEGVAHEASKYK